MKFEDRLVCAVLERVQRYAVDTIVCPFSGDLHHDHEVVARIAESASRHVPRLLMGQVNWHVRQPFTPNVFVDITETWEQKLKALEYYVSEYNRAGAEWYGFLDETTRTYGRMVGVERAEGFVSRKLLW